MKVYILLLLFFFSCSTLKKSPVCNENLAFKKEFLKNIKIIEDYFIDSMKVSNFDEYELLLTEERHKTYKLSLQFVSKYTHVSYDMMSSYDGSYPLGVYEKDREGWLKWYEENKCKNIQFK